jgi:hypothetical protein
VSVARALPRTPLVVLGSLFLAVAVGMAAPRMLDTARSMGRYIPRPDMAGDWLAGVLWAAALALLLAAAPVPRRDRRPLLVLWGAKCFVTLLFMLVYESAYAELDTYYYLREAAVPWMPRGTGLGHGTENVIALVWLHARVLASYHATKVSFALVGLAGVYFFYRGVVHATGREDVRALYALGLFPSVLFWSSILGKDPVQLLGIGLYGYGVLAWSRTRRSVYLLPLAVGVLVASMMRLWAAPILLFPLVVFAAWGIQGVWRRVVFVTLVAVTTLAAVNAFADAFGVETAQDVYQTTDALSRSWSGGGSGQTVSVNFTDWRSMVYFMPLGAFTALFRPLPGEIPNMFGLMSGMENALLLGLAVLAVLRSTPARLRHPVVLWAVVLVLLWASVYGFVSFQNLGTAARYKLQILPVVLALLLYLGLRAVPDLPRAAAPADTRARPLPVQG